MEPQEKTPKTGTPPTSNRSSFQTALKLLKWLAFAASLLVLISLWSLLIYARFNSQAVSERIPAISIGMLEMMTTGLVVLSGIWLVAILIWTLAGRWRWILLPAVPLACIVMMVWASRHYRVVFNADMTPLRIESRDEQYQLKPSEQQIASELTVGPTDFYRYLGPAQDLKVSWLSLHQTSAEDLEVLWRQPIGYGWSGFIAVGDTGFTQEQQGPWECVTAYDLGSGELLWVHRDRHRHDEPMGGIGPRATPTFHNGKLLTLGSLGTLNCLDATNGALLWQVELTERFNIPVEVTNEGTEQQIDQEKTNVLWGRSASPLVFQNQVIVPVGGIGKQMRSLVAFNLDNGEIIWEGGSEQVSYGSPVMGTLLGTPQILIVNESSVAGHDPATGKQLWSFYRNGNSGGGANTAQPVVVDDNKILLSKEYGLGGELIEVKKDESDRWSAESLWKNPRVLKTKLTVPVLRGEYAYSISSGYLECTHWPTGEKAWRGDRVQHGQLLLVDDQLLVMSEDGRLLLVSTDPEDYQLLWEKEDLLDGRCWNMLCVVGNKLVARSELAATCILLPAKVRDTESKTD